MISNQSQIQNQNQKLRNQIPLYNPFPTKRKYININIGSRVVKKKIEQLKEKNEKKDEDFSKENYLKGIKKLKNKGELSLGEHNRKNV